VDTIQESARTLLRLIDDILDFSKIEADKLEVVLTPTAVKPLLEQVARCMPKPPRQGPAAEAGDRRKTGPGPVAGPLRLRQILQNFVSNAVKFTANGGITLQVEVLEQEFSAQTCALTSLIPASAFRRTTGPPVRAVYPGRIRYQPPLWRHWLGWPSAGAWPA
jgi:signal transduction histidine kinase